MSFGGANAPSSPWAKPPVPHCYGTAPNAAALVLRAEAPIRGALRPAFQQCSPPQESAARRAGRQCPGCARRPRTDRLVPASPRAKTASGRPGRPRARRRRRSGTFSAAISTVAESSRRGPPAVRDALFQFTASPGRRLSLPGESRPPAIGKRGWSAGLRRQERRITGPSPGGPEAAQRNEAGWIAPCGSSGGATDAADRQLPAARCFGKFCTGKTAPRPPAVATACRRAPPCPSHTSQIELKSPLCPEPLG